jgi:catechol 2,3-dioxygenase-like lactoylglutathione lyase family enzyme
MVAERSLRPLDKPREDGLAYEKKAYCEHVAIRVRDIDWHIGFFRDVLGMGLRRELPATASKPRQVWTMGGIQLIGDPSFAGQQGQLAHLGIMVEDLDAVLSEAKGWGATELPQGRHWLALPDGLTLEIMQATGASVAEVLAINPRA